MATLSATEGYVYISDVIRKDFVIMSRRAIAGSRCKWMTIECGAVEIFSRLRVDQVPLGGHVGDLRRIVNLENYIIRYPAVVEAFQAHIKSRARSRAGGRCVNGKHLLVSIHIRVFTPQPTVFVGSIRIYDVPEIWR
jgi:hypothetical protein